jgi:hypothetical protein
MLPKTGVGAACGAAEMGEQMNVTWWTGLLPKWAVVLAACHTDGQGCLLHCALWVCARPLLPVPCRRPMPQAHAAGRLTESCLHSRVCDQGRLVHWNIGSVVLHLFAAVGA